jgi:hypothetical protein
MTRTTRLPRLALGAALAALCALAGCRQHYLGVADVALDGGDGGENQSGTGGTAGKDAATDAAAGAGAAGVDGGVDAATERDGAADGAGDLGGPEAPASTDGSDGGKDAGDASMDARPDLASDTPALPSTDAAPETSGPIDDARAGDGGAGDGGAAGACGQPLPAPIVYYAFEDCDASGRLRDTAAPGADPAIRSPGTRCVPGRAGTGLFFDGTDGARVISHVEARANVHVKRVTVAISVRPWRSPSAPIAGRWEQNSFLFSFDGASSHYSFKIGIPGSTPEGNWYETQASADDDTWVDLVGVFDGNTVRLYKDGVLADESPITLPPRDLQDTGVPLTFGYLIQNPEPSPAPPGFRGDLDEVRVWGTALTADQVARLRCH